MIHVEDEYVNEQGVIDFTGAAADPRGFTVLAVLFNVDNEKPQVCRTVIFSSIHRYFIYITTLFYSIW